MTKTTQAKTKTTTRRAAVARAEAARSLAYSWWDRSQATQGREQAQAEPTTGELLAWVHIHNKARAAGLAAADEIGPVAPFPDPRDVPSWSVKLEDAAADPGAAAAMHEEIRRLEAFAAANKGDLQDLGARWVAQALGLGAGKEIDS